MGHFVSALLIQGTDVMAEGHAAATLDADAHAKHLQCWAIFHIHRDETTKAGRRPFDPSHVHAFNPLQANARVINLANMSLVNPSVTYSTLEEVIVCLWRSPCTKTAFSCTN